MAHTSKDFYHTPDSQKSLHDTLQSVWAEFQQLAARAESEAKQTSDGRPSGETDFALARLSDRLDVLESKLANPTPPGALYQPAGVATFTLNGQTVAYETGTPEHLRFVKALRYGAAALPARDQERIVLAGADWFADGRKAMSEADDTRGGYLVSNEFGSDVLRLSVNYSPIRQVARVVPVGIATGLAQPIRGEVQPAVRVAETGDRSPSATFDLSFQLKNIPVHELLASTKLSRQLLADAHYPLDAELSDASARAFALKEGAEAITGDGNGCFVGLNNVALPAGQVASTTGTSSTIAAADLFTLVGKLKEAYLPNARFLMNNTSLLAVRKLRGDGTTGPLLFDVADGQSTLLGFPVTRMPNMDSPGSAGKHVIFFGDVQQAYTIVARTDMVVQRLSEVYAETGQVAFLIWSRSGGQCVMPDALARLTTA